MTEPAVTQRAAATTTIAVVLVSLFVALGFIAHHAAAGTALDHAVLAWMVNHRSPSLTSLAIAVTNAGSPVATGVIAVIAAAVLWRRSSSPRPAILILATLGAAGAISTVSKMIVGAHRPAQSVQLITETDAAFPSGHVTGTLALLGALTVVISQHSARTAHGVLIALTATATTVVALTRLYLGVHWLSDIVGGLLLGAAAAVIAQCAYRRMMGPLDARRRSDEYPLSGRAPVVAA
jgi:membrane-associated phospholipid phosphatase